MTPPAIERVDALCATALELTRSTSQEPEVVAVRARLAEPLRVAIAGQVKAGKSTLLNALVADRLAPTDAGECTRIVTWYHEGLGYEVRAIDRAGAIHELGHRRDGGALEIDLDGVRPEEIERLDVAWPSSALHQVTLIDTPGLASLDDSASVQTRDFLAMEEERPGGADAVLYLLRHLHRRDVEFLDTFLDRSLSNASPVNAIAVLSRADEIGAGRVDALDSAARIASRYRADPRLRALCLTVVPVATLVAETGFTLHEREGAALKQIAANPPELVDDLLLSADRFVRSELDGVSTDVRRELIDRLGLFGIRFAVEQFRTGAVTTPSDLARALVSVSGLGELQRLLQQHFFPRAQTLKARSALLALRSVARALEREAPDASAALDGGIEEIEASAHEFAELRLLHLVLSRTVELSDAEVEEVSRVTGPGNVAARLGCAPDADGGALRAAALGAVEKWRDRGADPRADRELCEASEVLVRSYEGLYAAVRE
ncbi:MAG: GTPase [Actinomycetota bacterium]